MREVSRAWEPKVGDFAVYPGHGVARVVDFRIQEIAGQELNFLVLRLVDDDSRILVPLDKLARVGLRQVMGRREAGQIWGILRKRTRKRQGGVTWSRQFRQFQEKVRTGSVFDAAEVLRDLLRLQKTKELSFGEHKLLESARALVVQELAAAQAAEAAEVEREIRATVM